MGTQVGGSPESPLPIAALVVHAVTACARTTASHNPSPCNQPGAAKQGPSSQQPKGPLTVLQYCNVRTPIATESPVLSPCISGLAKSRQTSGNGTTIGRRWYFILRRTTTVNTKQGLAWRQHVAWNARSSCTDPTQQAVDSRQTQPLAPY